MSKFNIFIISGGLGNQLFQIAAATNYSLKYNKKIYLDTTWCRNSSKTAFGCSKMLEKLKKKKIYLIKDIPIFFKFLVKIFKIFDTKFFNFFFCYFIKIINEKEPYKHQKLIAHKSLISIFVGSWQSEKYFFDCKELYKEILKDFFEISDQSIKKTITAKKNNSQKVALHSRQGDYMYLDGYGVLSNKYYSQSIKYFKNKFNNCEIIAFSDQINKLKEKKKLDVDYYFDDKNMSPKKILSYMASCDHFITANSTFSWWAAYLGDKPNKIIITPRKWFNGRDKTPDLIPENWIKFKNKHI